jgi:AAA+ ATPase superfamily predicted ATPase
MYLRVCQASKHKGREKHILKEREISGNIESSQLARAAKAWLASVMAVRWQIVGRHLHTYPCYNNPQGFRIKEHGYSCIFLISRGNGGQSLENLFDYPTTLRDPELFMGREEVLARIFALLKARQNVSLVGPRRIGKTSLLNCLRSPLIQQRFKFDCSHFFFLYLDLQNRSLKSNLNFFDEVYKIVKDYARKQGYTINGTIDDDDELNALLEEFEQRGQYPVLIIDTFDEIAQYNPASSSSVFSFLRSLGTAGQISYVIASIDTLGDLLRQLQIKDDKHGSPFPNIFATLRLSSFTEQEARAMLSETSARGGLPFTEKEIAWVMNLAGTHPFLLQQVATLLFEEKRRRGSGKVDYHLIQEEVQQNLASHFEDCWLLLSAEKRKAIITDQSKLDGKKSITQENWDSRIYPEICRNELFRSYLHDAGHLITFPPELKHALEHFDNPGALGENNELVARLPFIAARIEQQKASSPATRGRVIQTVLREALDHMQGEGKRTDEARDWASYNILYYRHFNQRLDLKQGVVARKLGVSERQYYRLLTRAIEQLWKELQTMDAVETLKPGD